MPLYRDASGHIISLVGNCALVLCDVKIYAEILKMKVIMTVFLSLNAA